MMNFSERVLRNIRDTMQANDITQRALACEMLISEAAVSQMLHADSNLTLHRVDQIYAALREILSRQPRRTDWSYLNALCQS